MKQFRGRRPNPYMGFRPRRPYMPPPFYSPYSYGPDFVQEFLQYEGNIEEYPFICNWKLTPSMPLTEYKPARGRSTLPLMLCRKSFQSEDQVRMDIFGNEISLTEISDLSGSELVYSKDGWLLFIRAISLHVRGVSFFLHNIFTGERFDLPDMVKYTSSHVMVVGDEIVKMSEPNSEFDSYRFFRLEMEGRSRASWVQMNGAELANKSWFEDGMQSFCVEGEREAVYKLTLHRIGNTGEKLGMNVQDYDLAETGAATFNLLPFTVFTAANERGLVHLG